MNTINQTIPAAFSPDTAFAIALQSVNDDNERENEIFIPFRFVSVAEEEFTRRGIPHSALHD
jgi:hypothetical protein